MLEAGEKLRFSFVVFIEFKVINLQKTAVPPDLFERNAV